MISIELKNTYKLEQELKSIEEEEDFNILQITDPELANRIKATENIYKDREYKNLEPEEKLQFSINQNYIKESKKLNISNKYFLGCSLANYQQNFDNRFIDYKNKYIDAVEHNFIFEEFQNINKFSLPYYIDVDFKKSVNFSIERTKEYLKKRLSLSGYKFETSYNNSGEIKTLAIKDFSVININEDTNADLSDSKATEKIIYLRLIGFFKHIKEREPSLNDNQIATLVSGITGEKYDTIKSYLYPILSTGVSQRNNPFSREKKVAIIKNKLIDLGLKNI
jgi:hypothetical protein